MKKVILALDKYSCDIYKVLIRNHDEDLVAITNQKDIFELNKANIYFDTKEIQQIHKNNLISNKIIFQKINSLENKIKEISISKVYNFSRSKVSSYTLKLIKNINKEGFKVDENNNIVGTDEFYENLTHNKENTPIPLNVIISKLKLTTVKEINGHNKSLCQHNFFQIKKTIPKESKIIAISLNDFDTEQLSQIIDYTYTCFNLPVLIQTTKDESKSIEINQKYNNQIINIAVKKENLEYIAQEVDEIYAGEQLLNSNYYIKAKKINIYTNKEIQIPYNNSESTFLTNNFNKLLKNRNYFTFEMDIDNNENSLFINLFHMINSIDIQNIKINLKNKNIINEHIQLVTDKLKDLLSLIRIVKAKTKNDKFLLSLQNLMANQDSGVIGNSTEELFNRLANIKSKHDLSHYNEIEKYLFQYKDKLKSYYSTLLKLKEYNKQDRHQYEKSKNSNITINEIR